MDEVKGQMGFQQKITFRNIPAHWEKWGVRLTAVLTFFMGLINLLSAVQPAIQTRLAIIESIIPLDVRRGSRITSALAGFALIILAASLWRRKRSAWILSTFLLIITFITHLVKGLDFEEASFTLGLLFLLAIFRHSYHTISDPPSVRQGLQVLATAFLFTMFYGVVGFFFLDKHFKIHFGILEALQQTIVMFTSFYNPGLEPITGFGRYFAGSIYVIGLSTIGFAIIMLIRPVLVREPATKEERARAETTVEQYGRTSLARAVLFNDKSYFFGPGETVIAYAAHNRGVLVLGDPIGPDEHLKASIAAFLDYCKRNDWNPSFISTLPDYLKVYEEFGLEALCIGYEAIVDLGRFSLAGSENKDVRNAVSKMQRNGYMTEVHLPPLSKTLVDSLHEISDAWLTMRRGGEMHFSDGWFNEEYIRNGPVIVVHTSTGRPTAFANIVSEYQKNELTIDLMRHDREIEHGTMEFLFAQMLQWAKENGYTTFSLGLSAIVGVGERPEDPRLDQAIHTISEYISRFYNFKGLHKFKEKFHPQWEPRYLVYRGLGSMPLVLNTLLQVHSGDHFLWKFLKK